MERNQFNKHFHDLKPYIIDRWNKLTEQDMNQIDGRFDLFCSEMQNKYKISKDNVEEQFHNWKPNVHFEVKNRSKYQIIHVEEEQEVNIGKWLLVAGIPFLLLIGVLGTQFNSLPDSSTYVPASYENTLAKPVSGTTQDETIVENIRKVLFSNSLLLADLEGLKVSSSAGVVTVYGSVKNEDEKALVKAHIEKIPGVVTVINNIGIRN